MITNHNQWVLSHLREYDSFLDSLKTIADMGCGSGQDIAWWATLTTRDDPPQPYNYNCFALDRNPLALEQVPPLENIHRLCKDFTKPHLFPVKIDLMWAHDSLQFSASPVDTLRIWNEEINVNGMLVLCVPQHSGVEYNRYYSRTYSGCYNNFTPTSLIYMLAVNGFDCRDAYLLKQFNNPWIHIAVYKSDIEPMDPSTTTWHDLVATGLLHPSIVDSVNKYGYLRQEDIVMPWLDRENYFVDYTSAWTELPKDVVTEDIPPTSNAIVSNDITMVQAPATTKATKILKPIKSIKPPKKKYD